VNELAIAIDDTKNTCFFMKCNGKIWRGYVFVLFGNHTSEENIDIISQREKTILTYV